MAMDRARLDLVQPTAKTTFFPEDFLGTHMIVSPQTAHTFRRKQRILSASVAEEIVMLSPEKGQYYNLNAVGGRIWRLLEMPQSLDQIVTALAEVYDAPEERIRAEAGAFLDRLEREGLLEVVTTDTP